MEASNHAHIDTDKYLPDTRDQSMDRDFWDSQYQANSAGWDIGEISPPLRGYIDQLADKNLKILIPGCGRSYEAAYLLQLGFIDITVIDIAPYLIDKLKEQFKGNPNIKIVLCDFFTHKGEYDLILEQTFFCAIDPALRINYVATMHALLAPAGKLVGVLFNREFDQQGPPFGGSQRQYKQLFEMEFSFYTFEPCYNSFVKRAGTELFINFQKKVA